MNKQTKASTTFKNNGRLMALGNFVFEIASAVYQQVERQNTWRHPSSDPVGTDPTYQYTGRGAETFKLSGVIYKELSNPQALDTLRDMADTGEAFVLVSGSGKVFGFYIITNITEGQSYFDSTGEPLRIEFSLDLTLAKRQQKSTSEPTKATKAN